MSNLNRRQTILGAAGLGVLGSAGARAHPDPNRPIGAWTRMADMPFPVQEIYPVAHREFSSQPGSFKPIENRLLVNAGGLTDAPGYAHNVTDEVTIYDPLTDQWRYGPPLPAPMHHVALVSNSGYLSAIGGFLRNGNGGWQMQSRVWQTDDIENGIWREAPPLPIAQAETVAVSLNGRIHVVGGRSPAGSRNREWGDHIDTAKTLGVHRQRKPLGRNGVVAGAAQFRRRRRLSRRTLLYWRTHRRWRQFRASRYLRFRLRPLAKGGAIAQIIA